MTLQQTRQLGIEVERRLQTILPTLKLENKIDTEDIYAFLNLFLRLYIDQIYKLDDNVVSGTRQAVLVEDILRSLTKHEYLVETTLDTLDDINDVYTLPNDYYKYIRSVSHITSNYSSVASSGIVSNILAKQTDANNVINLCYDKNRILRNPVVVLEGNILKVIRDYYTTIDKIDLTYIKLPINFSVLTGTACELPFECFDDLVSGTVDLYIKHLTATQPKQPRKQREEAEE